MKNNNSLKALLLFTVFIILFSISIIFFNLNNKSQNIVLANKEEILTTFKPREYKTQNNTNTNHLGGSNDDILLNTFSIKDNIYVLFETKSNDNDLCLKENNDKTISIALFDSNGSLISVKTINIAYEYITSFYLNNFIYIFENNSLGLEIAFDTTNNTSKTIEHKKTFDNVIKIENEIIYIYNGKETKILNIKNNLISIPNNFTYIDNIVCDNKNYLLFNDGQNQHFFNIQERGFTLSFFDCEILEILSFNNNILIIFNTNSRYVFSKFTSNFEECFSTELEHIGTNLIQLLTKNNGYLIYAIPKNKIIEIFICSHGDIIYTKTTEQTEIKQVIAFYVLDNNFIIIGKTISDNFYLKILNISLEEKKYMALNACTIYNYIFFLKDNKIHLFATTDFANFEFSDNFGKQDVFVFIK